MLYIASFDRLPVTCKQQTVAGVAISNDCELFTMDYFLKLIFTYSLIVGVTRTEENCSIDGKSCSENADSHENFDRYSQGNSSGKKTMSWLNILIIRNCIIDFIARVILYSLIASSVFFFIHVESNELVSKIHQAFLDYHPCVEKHCGCHANTITKSLHPFRNGITQEMIDDVRKYGTKYQIIDKKIYRDPNCMFPSRCAGIEYFLKANIQKIPDLEMIVNTRDWPQINIHHVRLLVIIVESNLNQT